ncbi:sarcolemmal membrane-associated protein [Orussus abietinus]|uniref:sarcolemmal membrane-associated protein n=1 Tax=Orussus abietinus TaxID=222816 RepID=UPI000626635E|nr:sarcolemmal membrane-associated protein [Orussus abietinus]
MVVASGGWTQYVDHSPNRSENEMNAVEASEKGKMTAKAVLICRDNSHPFMVRTLSLEQPVKIGRSVARARAMQTNAIFDCKVLSRNHAQLWYDSGKFYLQDTKSSNGTFVNNQRLSSSGFESSAREVSSGDIVQFGVDVVESTKKVTHGCIVATLKLYLPDGKEAKASYSTTVACSESNVSLEDLHKLNQLIQDAARREKSLHSKLTYLRQLVENAKKATDWAWTVTIDEDRLLSRVETLENQLAVCSKHYTDDKLRSEILELREEKDRYQNVTKEALLKVLQEKLELAQRLAEAETRLGETEEECQSLHEVERNAQTELRDLAARYTDLQKELYEKNKALSESEEKVREIERRASEERTALLNRLDNQSATEQFLQARLRDSRLDTLYIRKEITALRNYMQTLQDMNSKLMSDENKDDVNPIEAMNAILDRLKPLPFDDFEGDSQIAYGPREDEDNQINARDSDSKVVNSDRAFVKSHLDHSSTDDDNLAEYIVPPLSRRTLVNGNAISENLDASAESDANSESAEDASTVADNDDDASEKSVIEVRRESESSPSSKSVTQASAQSAKHEVRFASGVNGEQLEVRYDPVTAEPTEESDDPDSADRSAVATHGRSPSKSRLSGPQEAQGPPDDNRDAVSENEAEEEAAEGEYVKTLKPLPRSESLQRNLSTREFALQALIGSLDSLKADDEPESQQLVRRKLEELRDWLIREPTDSLIGKLKELYYRAKNETQRMQEVNEELVILKEKYNTGAEERAELTRRHAALRAQCGDLLNATYSVPVQYVAPIAIALLWMLLEKIF